MPACARPGTYVPRQTHDCDAAVLVRTRRTACNCSIGAARYATSSTTPLFNLRSSSSIDLC